MKVTRRQFVVGGAFAAGLAGVWKYLAFAGKPKKILGGIQGASSSLGHKLRTGNFPEISDTVEKNVVIVGAGIAGLAAAYRLRQSGEENFIVLDLEKAAGGNSASGKNEVSAYPWGAHYVPLPTEESRAVRRLFEELDVITGYDAEGLPVYNDYYICGEPHERLFIHGRWHEGLLPVVGVAPEEEAQYKKFFVHMHEMRDTKGHDGKRAFAIPVDESSQDDIWIALDQITMAAWMAREGYTSKHLEWYVDYCCRDDYGTTFRETSAWAGIHYFASRSGKAANAKDSNVLTWPEGNGWLVGKMAAAVQENIVTQALAYHVVDEGKHVSVEYWDENRGKSVRIKAKAVVMAAPQFISSRLVKSDTKRYGHAAAFSYSPWAVANITLGRMPQGRGTRLCWDNVVYGSEFLGYVVATHQIPQMKPLKTVITYYWPLSHISPAQARQEAMGRSYEDWQGIILKELLHVHPELEGYVESVDIWVWGHAMVRPVTGFIWGQDRKASLAQTPPIFSAHSDMSGISIFEEAYTHGVRAAENVMGYLGRPYESVL